MSSADKSICYKKGWVGYLVSNEIRQLVWVISKQHSMIKIDNYQLGSTNDHNNLTIYLLQLVI